MPCFLGSCFNCGQLGHTQKECRKGNQKARATNKQKSPGEYPIVKKAITRQVSVILKLAKMDNLSRKTGRGAHLEPLNKPRHTQYSHCPYKCTIVPRHSRQCCYRPLQHNSYLLTFLGSHQNRSPQELGDPYPQEQLVYYLESLV